MAFCVNCGKQLAEGAIFCAFCGTKVGEAPVQSTPATPIQPNTQRKQEYVGKVFKCPNCGEVISQSAARCTSCGYEIGGKEANETMKRFSEQLMELESRRGLEKKSIGESIANDFFNPAANYRGTNTDAQIVALIKSYPIPNNIEEISEFMFLAIGNIDVSLSKNSMFKNSLNNKQRAGAQMEISDAWVLKMQQIYAKAERAFPNDPAFEQIKELYLSKMKELRIKVK